MRCQSEGGTGHQKVWRGGVKWNRQVRSISFLCRVVSRFVRDRQGLCWRWTAEGRVWRETRGDPK